MTQQMLEIRMEINKIKNIKIERQQDQKYFFQKNDKIDTHLAILTKKKKGRRHI